MKERLPWVKLPSAWIEEKRLREFVWGKGRGANNLAALMGLIVISHHVEDDSGMARLTYDDLCTCTGLSRAKLSAGLGILAERKLIEREPDGRSSFRLSDYNPKRGWAQLPAAGLYRSDTITAFNDFRLRLPAELEAMKLYLLFAGRRDHETNSAKITYAQIEDYSGVAHNNIRRALSILAANNLVHIYPMPSINDNSRIANSYRLVHLNTRQHIATIQRDST